VHSGAGTGGNMRGGGGGSPSGSRGFQVKITIFFSCSCRNSILSSGSCFSPNFCRYAPRFEYPSFQILKFYVLNRVSDPGIRIRIRIRIRMDTHSNCGPDPDPGGQK
jgi:hypothetical protein